MHVADSASNAPVSTYFGFAGTDSMTTRGAATDMVTTLSASGALTTVVGGITYIPATGPAVHATATYSLEKSRPVSVFYGYKLRYASHKMVW